MSQRWRLQQQEAWRQWLHKHQQLIQASGLPPEILESESNWRNFIEHGFLDYNIHSDFDSNMLSDEQKQCVALLIRRTPGTGNRNIKLCLRDRKYLKYR